MSAILAPFRKRFLRASEGTVAIEFSMVILPLLLILFSIIEQALIYVVSGTLEAATYDVGRTIRTGEVQKAAQADPTKPTAAVTANKFKSTVCAELTWLGDQCMENLYVDVRTLTSFTDSNAPPAMKDGKPDATKLSWDPGVAGDLVLVRTYYQWPVSVGWSAGLLKTEDGATLVTAAATFKNEPF